MAVTWLGSQRFPAINFLIGALSGIDLNEYNVVGQIVHPGGTAADRLHPEHAVLIDHRLLAVVLLDVDTDREHTNDGDQRKGNDAQADRQLDHGETVPAPEMCRVIFQQFHSMLPTSKKGSVSTMARPVMWFTRILV